MTAGEARATSFGQVADDYDRVRPGPPEAALDWLVPPDCEIAVDVAAGTGLFSRALARRAGQVIAVEPDDRMRAVLAARSPGVRVVAGRGEAIPVPDASAGFDSSNHFESQAITGLTPGALYHFRIVAANLLGSRAGSDQTFTTEPPLQFQAPTAVAPTGRRAAALKKCKHKHGAKRKKCKRKANKLLV